MPKLLKPMHPRTHAVQQEKPPQWAACTAQLESSPLHAAPREKPTLQWRPGLVINTEIILKKIFLIHKIKIFPILICRYMSMHQLQVDDIKCDVHFFMSLKGKNSALFRLHHSWWLECRYYGWSFNSHFGPWEWSRDGGTEN